MTALLRSAASVPAPFAEKDWVAEGDQHPEIARVKDVYWDDIANEWVMDQLSRLPSDTADRLRAKYAKARQLLGL